KFHPTMADVSWNALSALPGKDCHARRGSEIVNGSLRERSATIGSKPGERRDVVWPDDGTATTQRAGRSNVETFRARRNNDDLRALVFLDQLLLRHARPHLNALTDIVTEPRHQALDEFRSAADDRSAVVWLAAQHADQSSHEKRCVFENRFPSPNGQQLLLLRHTGIVAEIVTHRVRND